MLRVNWLTLRYPGSVDKGYGRNDGFTLVQWLCLKRWSGKYLSNQGDPIVQSDTCFVSTWSRASLVRMLETIRRFEILGPWVLGNEPQDDSVEGSWRLEMRMSATFDALAMNACSHLLRVLLYNFRFSLRFQPCTSGLSTSITARNGNIQMQQLKTDPADLTTHHKLLVSMASVFSAYPRTYPIWNHQKKVTIEHIKST